jgi:hypothetical protein
MLRRWSVATSCVVLASLGVGCGSGEPASDPAAEPPPAAAEGSPEASPPATPGASSAPSQPDPSTSPGTPEGQSSTRDATTACARVEACCTAYVAVVGDDAEAERARRACDELARLESLGDAAGEACLAALEGWRQSLELREREVPASCR